MIYISVCIIIVTEIINGYMYVNVTQYEKTGLYTQNTPTHIKAHTYFLYCTECCINFVRLLHMFIQMLQFEFQKCGQVLCAFFSC